MGRRLAALASAFALCLGLAVTGATGASAADGYDWSSGTRFVATGQEYVAGRYALYQDAYGIHTEVHCADGTRKRIWGKNYGTWGMTDNWGVPTGAPPAYTDFVNGRIVVWYYSVDLTRRSSFRGWLRTYPGPDGPHPGTHLHFGSDGRLSVVNSSDGRAIWQSPTAPAC